MRAICLIIICLSLNLPAMAEQASTTQLMIELQQVVTGSQQHRQLLDKNGSVKHYGTNDRDSVPGYQRLRVDAGQSAAVVSGQLVPMASLQTDADGRARPVIEHKEISSGFQVTPYVSGDNVRLDITPFAASLSDSGGKIEKQQLHTTVTVPFGQWVELGGSYLPPPPENTRRYSTQRSDPGERSVFVRVIKLGE